MRFLRRLLKKHFSRGLTQMNADISHANFVGQVGNLPPIANRPVEYSDKVQQQADLQSAADYQSAPHDHRQFRRSRNVFIGGHRSGRIFATVLCCVLPAQDKPPQLPVAPGREVVLKICAMCHEIETVIASRRTRIGWDRTVDDMIGRGAEGSDAEMDAVVEYLTAYFGKVNVNTASAGELKKAVGLSTPEAEAIVAYRERKGNFKNFEELTKVPRLRAETLAAKRGLIAFSL